ncbi:MAG: 4-(cytidine 5'-diphospho)-2-C-methyl-D-erythritol kinase [Tepidimonas taiwanensis]|nr:4-(cytidine 5'-diphospho)-2-C-methyl-D-erythritol kinase [Tepidimonas taiwanensis]
MDQIARAKINLALHVTGRRDDGYHLLDSLVVFADFGDLLRLVPGALSLTIDGPFGAALAADDDNLCLRAARLAGGAAAIRLTKNLPVASGIGGGSADAAAVLRGLAAMGHAIPPGVERLGADVPVCVASRPVRMRGIGEVLDPVPPFPPLWVVLVNPGVAVSTPAVFKALESRDNPPLPTPVWETADSLLGWLARCRNDLEPPARRLVPQIDETLAALRDSGAALARMSGSGATCFGLYRNAKAARDAAKALARPGWWVAQGKICD